MKLKLWHLSKKTTIWLYRFFEALVAFVLVVVSLGFWKLYTEPMDAKFLLPPVSAALLPKGTEYSLDVGSAVLSADFNEAGLFHLHMRDVRLIRPDKTVAIDLPTADLSYGLWHVLTLNYIPNKLTITSPDIRMVVDPNGRWLLQASPTAEVQTTHTTELPKLRRILKHALSFDNIEITDGVLMLEDMALGQKLSVPHFEVKLRRHYGFRHMGHLNAVAQVSDHLMDIKAKAVYNRWKNNLNVEMGVTPIYISRWGRFGKLLEGLDIPVSAVISADFDTKKSSQNIAESLSKAKFQMKSLAGGTIRLPSPIKNTYDVKSVEINGAISSGFKTLKIAKSQAKLVSGVPADVEVEVKGVDKFLKTHEVSDVETTLKAVVKNVALEDVPKLWPVEQGPDAHAWVRNHLSGGRVPQADFILTFKGDEVVDVFGDVRTTGVRVDYLPKMPALEDVSAEVLLYLDKVKILGNKGHAGKVNLVNADLTIGPIGDDAHLKLALDVTGPVSEMLLAINQKPLQLLKPVDLNWKKIAGTAETHVQLDFPLDENRLVKELLVDVSAVGKNLGMQIPKLPFALSNGKMDLMVNNEKLSLDGTVAFENQPVQFSWIENFNPTSGANSIFEVKGDIEAKSVTPWVADIEKYITGVVPFEVTLKRYDKKQIWTGNLLADLSTTITELHPLALIKKDKEPAQLIINLERAANDWASGLGHFELLGEAEGKKMELKGSVGWGDEWNIELKKVLAKNNNFAGQMTYKPDKFSLVLNGESWNLSKIKEWPLLTQKQTKTDVATLLPKDIFVQVDLKKLILNPNKHIEGIVCKADRKGNVWNTFHIQALCGDPLVVFYNAETREFSGSLPSLGDLLTYVGASDRFSGGQVVVKATQDQKGVIKGNIMVDKTELNETGFMLQAVSILGIVDAIRGKNIVFDEIQIPLELTPEGILTLTDAYAASSNIGVTFRGTINLDAMDLSGAVVPAYAVNSLPGKIPLIGALFRDGEGGGLLSVKYSVTGKVTDPEVEFHPLSSIVPGVLGKIF
ncbi:MAG: hypothetical protein II942_02220 [Alphaproteobacteria bacterium]|nr:hypothetical protein [Alphaproteobacteria bacterium]